MPVKTTNQLNRVTWLVDQHIYSDKERLHRWRKVVEWRWHKANDLLTDEDPQDIALDEIGDEMREHYAEGIGLRDMDLVLDLFDAALAEVDWRRLAEKFLVEIHRNPAPDEIDI